MNDLNPPPNSPADRDRRGGVAFGIAGASGMASALLISGWLGDRVRTPIALFIAVIGGLIAGLIVGNSRDERAHVGGSAIVGTIAIMFVVSAYIKARSEVYNVELLLPAVIGALPGRLVYSGLKRFVPVPKARSLAAIGFAATALVMAFIIAPGAPSSDVDVVTPAAPDR